MVQAWGFSNFVSLQLSLWHLDPLRASEFVPLPNWIQTRRAIVNKGLETIALNGLYWQAYTL